MTVLAGDRSQTAQRRLAWRCRRGLLELDIVLQQFVAGQFKTLSSAELAAFDRLLSLPDNDFWSLIAKADVVNADAVLESLLCKIRA